MRLSLAVALLLLGAAPQDDVVKKIVPDAEKIKKLVRKISKESRDKIEKALGEKLLDADLAPPLWECTSTVPSVSSMERTKCLVTVVTLKGPKGAIRIGVAVATVESTLHAVKVLDNADDKNLESKAFLSQFDGFEYTPNLWNAPDVLAAAIKKASGTDDAAKEVDALLKMNGMMRALAPQWERLLAAIEKKDKAAAEEAASMEKAFDDSLKLLPNAKFLGASRQEKFKTATLGTKTDLSALKSLIDGGKFDDAFRKTGEIESARCAKCHGANRRAFRDARLAQNLGNGPFSTKLDVVVPDPKLEASAQALAAGVRKAILLASEAK